MGILRLMCRTIVSFGSKVKGINIAILYLNIWVKDSMEALKTINYGILFLVELGMLVSFGMWGFSLHVPTIVKFLVGLGVPAMVIVIWGRYFAPKASHPLGEPLNAFGELSLFIVSAIALYAAGYHQIAIIFGVVAVVSETISLVWK